MRQRLPPHLLTSPHLRMSPSTSTLTIHFCVLQDFAADKKATNQTATHDEPEQITSIAPAHPHALGFCWDAAASPRGASSDRRAVHAPAAAAAFPLGGARCPLPFGRARGLGCPESTEHIPTAAHDPQRRVVVGVRDAAITVAAGVAGGSPHQRARLQARGSTGAAQAEAQGVQARSHSTEPGVGGLCVCVCVCVCVCICVCVCVCVCE